jgi:solute:Na+ symporter, SSS family
LTLRIAEIELHNMRTSTRRRCAEASARGSGKHGRRRRLVALAALGGAVLAILVLTAGFPHAAGGSDGDSPPRTTPIDSPAEQLRAAGFGWANWLTLSAYLAVVAAIGGYFARREKGTEDYFLGGRRVPWWAVGLSIFGTQLSAITYLAIPAKTYAADWTYLVINFGIVAIAPLVVFVFLPLFRRPNVTTAYEYLGIRFGGSLRVFGSLSYSVLQLGRLGVVLLLPSLALSAVTGANVYLCIAIMGVLSTAYTVAGGIEAVVWTDVLQVVVLLGGALLAIGLMVAGVEGGLTTIVAEAAAEGKLTLARWDWDLTTDSFLVILLAAVFTTFVPYTSDQAVVQRYLSTPTARQAAQAVWTNALLTIPASLLFFSVGTALYVFYRHHPEWLGPLDQTDQIFPWFITHQMPRGLGGLVIAGVFAAAMSSLDSSIHAVATTLTSDLYRPMRPGRGEAHYLAVARWLTLAFGVLGTASSLVLATVSRGPLWDVFLAVVGLLGGTMAGLFALGAFTRRTSAIHAWLGVAASVAALAYAYFATPLDGLLYAAIGVATCFVVGTAAAWIRPAPP